MPPRVELETPYSCMTCDRTNTTAWHTPVKTGACLDFGHVQDVVQELNDML